MYVVFLSIHSRLLRLLWGLRASEWAHPKTRDHFQTGLCRNDVRTAVIDSEVYWARIKQKKGECNWNQNCTLFPCVVWTIQLSEFNNWAIPVNKGTPPLRSDNYVWRGTPITDLGVWLRGSCLWPRYIQLTWAWFQLPTATFCSLYHGIQ